MRNRPIITADAATTARIRTSVLATMLRVPARRAGKSGRRPSAVSCASRVSMPFALTWITAETSIATTNSTSITAIAPGRSLIVPVRNRAETAPTTRAERNMITPKTTAQMSRLDMRDRTRNRPKRRLRISKVDASACPMSSGLGGRFIGRVDGVVTGGILELARRQDSA